MANPLPFTPAHVNPKLELERRLAAAPIKHAEAILVGYDLLQAAHDQGILDLLDGLVGSKDFIAGKIAEYAKLPEGIAAIRNLLAATRILSAIDPELVDHLMRGIIAASARHKAEVRPPGLWTIFRRLISPEGRRGLSLATLLLTELGRATKST